MRAALIVNPQAGNLAGLAEPRAALSSALRASGFLVDAAVAESASFDQQWTAVEACDAEVVFVAGGDGTLRSAAARLPDRRRAFAPLPGGTMNRVCARRGLPNDPLAAAASFRPDAFTDLDVATANGEVFLYQSILGKPSRLMRFREMQRGTGLRGWWPMLRAAGRETIVACHHPLRHPAWAAARRVPRHTERTIALLQGHGVAALLCGHLHRAEVTRLGANGPLQVVAPSALSPRGTGWPNGWNLITTEAGQCQVTLREWRDGAWAARPLDAA